MEKQLLEDTGKLELETRLSRYPGTGCFLLPVEGEVLLVMSLVQEPSHPDAG